MSDKDGIELPHEYAPRRVRERLLPWWEGEAGAAVRRYGPVIWPGMHPSALLAWSVTSTGPTELGPAPDFVCGLWGVERERLDGLARAARPYLSREVRTGLTRREYLGDLEAQCVCGLLTYRKHFDGVAEDIGARVSAAMGRDTPAAWRVAAAAYSSGGGKVEAALNEWRDELPGVAPSEWWPWLGQRIALHPSRTVGKYQVRGKWNLAFMILRAEQRAESAFELAARVIQDDGEAEAVARWLGCWTTRPEHAATVARLKELADA